LTSLNISSSDLTGEYGDEMSGDTELSAVIRYRTTPDIYFAGITALANAIPDMGALTSLNLAANNLGQLVLPEGWSGPDGDGEYEDPDGEYHKQAPAGSKPEGIIALANVIPDMGALTTLDISNNAIGISLPPGWTHSIGTNNGLPGFRSPEGDWQEGAPEGACTSKGLVALAGAIRDNEALTKLIFSGDKWYNGQTWATPEPVTLEVGMAEVDFGNKGLGAAGAIIVAAWLSHKDNGALFSVDFGDNDIPADKLQEIDQAVRSNRLRLIREDSNKSLSEIDLSSRYLDVKDAIVVAEYIKDNGALIKLDISGNYIGATQEGDLKRICVASDIELII
jgi:hypothetical protein